MGQSLATPPAEAAGGRGVTDALLDGLPAEPSPAAADGQADDLLSQLAGAEIDRMLAAADVEPTVELPPVPVPVVDVVEPPAAVAEAPPAEVPVVVTALPAVDLNAVLAEAIANPTGAEPGLLDELPPAAFDRLPWVLRPLALLSRPLDHAPDALREAIGKVAVVTLVNAVGVIAYVAMFRRHG